MDNELVFTPSEFVAVLNQTLEYAYPSVVIEGELAEFRVSKNTWVYFKLVDDQSSVSFFGSIYGLPGPLQDGLSVRVAGAPRLHPRFGFSVNFSSVAPVGEGSIKKAADLLAAKLQKEGLFEQSRKRVLPLTPSRVGLVTSAKSAACADFMKVLNERWGGVEVLLIDSLVQGEQAATQLVHAIEHFNQLAHPPEVLVITRGGGSAEDLSVFNDERVVRAVAASRAPTLVAVGHETDVSLAELAADRRASTPTAAAAGLVPDRKQVMAELASLGKSLKQTVAYRVKERQAALANLKLWLPQQLKDTLKNEKVRLANLERVLKALSPEAILAKGYALLRSDGGYITSAKAVSAGDRLKAQLHDGTIGLTVEKK